MKLEKKHWIIIGVVVAIILVWYFFLRKKKAESSYRATRVTPLGSAVSGLSSVSCPRGWKLVGNKCVPDTGTGTGPTYPGGGEGTAFVIGQQGTGNNSRKCYCGKDDSTPPRDVWNFACCDKATT
jgi:uncharacterized membrane protein